MLGKECNEAEESATAWTNCAKNPGHKKFFQVQDFIANHLPQSVSDGHRELLRLSADLTVRLRVSYTSWDRPDTDGLSEFRGSSRLRVGTGFIRHVRDPLINKPYTCDQCEGTTVQKYWVFHVRTAQHVVYNTEEAEKTKVDLFYDDETSEQGEKMGTAHACRVVRCNDDLDVCYMVCMTHDERIGERIESLYRRWDSLPNPNKPSPPNTRKLCFSTPLRKLLSWGRRDYALIISHPHGQHKKLTVGRVRNGFNQDADNYVEYHTATCPGSSGALVIPLYLEFRVTRPRHWRLRHWLSHHWSLHHVVRGFVHSGTHSEPHLVFKDQVNYGNYWFSLK